jgi:hypothetical protein
MRQTMRTVMVRETLLALLVLALAFVNFGHNTLAFAADGHVVSVSHGYCGNVAAPRIAPLAIAGNPRAPPIV